MSEAQSPPSTDSIQWAKALIAVPLTDAVVAELLGVMRGGTERAAMAAWALGVGEVPPHIRSATVRALLEVAADRRQLNLVREHAIEGVAEQLQSSDPADRDRHDTDAGLMALLNDPSPAVRFWSAFALGQLRTAAAVPLLHAVTMDRMTVPGWWSVGEEASDAINIIEGREPPPRGPTAK
jgi:HEAT repeat protein